MWASQVALVVKNSPANAGDPRDTGSIPGLGRSLGEGHGNPLQYSCLENPMDRGAWQATVHGVAESDTTEVTARICVGPDAQLPSLLWCIVGLQGVRRVVRLQERRRLERSPTFLSLFNTK